MIKCLSTPAMQSLHQRFERLYGPTLAARCMERLAMLVGRYGLGYGEETTSLTWSQQDSLLITYGDMIRQTGETPLATLKRFADAHLRGAFHTLHLLPFFPYSSDDGFSVIHYRTVQPALGDWSGILNLKAHFHLMYDLVLNHVSRKSGWFKDYTTGIAPARDYFIEADPNTDLSAVTRPRRHPLLTSVHTRSGNRWVWTTFSEDQIDLNFANPDVLFEFLDILLFYIHTGADAIRLDAIAYLWKTIGTSCIHLPQTHEVVKLFRDFIELLGSGTLLLTETNVPHEENVSYFGAGDEAHMVYQFSLPPLLLHALLTGNSGHLSRWAAGLKPPAPGCTFLNFTASHDGIGVRPLHGLLPAEELDTLAQAMLARGGHVSQKRNSDGTDSPYEFNITYFSALSFLEEGRNALHLARFLCSQTVPMALQGVPAFYFNSLLAAPNDPMGVQCTGQARSINRKKWDEGEIQSLLHQPDSPARQTLDEITRRLRLRAGHAAFHPDGEQAVPKVSDAIFAVLRIAPDQSERILCAHNFQAEKTALPTEAVQQALQQSHVLDLLTGRPVPLDAPIGLEPYQTLWLTSAG